MTDSICHWKIIQSRCVLDNPYLRVRQDRVLLPNGTMLDDYYVQESRGYVSIFCLTTEGKVVLTRQYRHGIGKVALGLPTGMYDEHDQSPAECVRRELEEETGYIAAEVELVAELATNPARSTERCWLFIGRGGKKECDPRPELTEEIETILVDPEDLLDMVRRGEIFGMGQVASIYIACDRLGLLAGRSPR